MTDLPNENHIFLTSKYQTYHYRQLFGFAKWLSQELSRKNIKPSEKEPLLIFTDQSDEVIFTIAASFLLDIPIYPLHSDSTTSEIDQALTHITPSARFYGNRHPFDKLDEIPAISIQPRHINIPGEYDPALFTLDRSDSCAGYFLTSGTTSNPKIVPIKREQIFVAAEASADNLQPGKDRYWLLCLPLNHVGGINVIYRSIIYQSAIYSFPSFDTAEIRKLLNNNPSFEAASMVPTMLAKLMEDKFFKVHFDFKGILLGGGPIDPDMIERAVTRGIPVIISYGMTETCAQIAANPLLKAGGRYIPKTSVGNVFKANSVEIRSENGTPVRYNEPGQIWLKGPQIFDGYLNPKETRAVFDKDGWFNTGDFGHLNKNGHLFIDNRKSDKIITGGENVNPVEVESAINKVNGISESAVIGVPDDIWGQKVVAYIVPSNDETPTIDFIIASLKKTLRDFKIPKEFIAVESLPKTLLQKVKKGTLLKEYLKK
tara:strand:- start:14014 stop:15471 length:1458 start_codon:yes stop_codon:yes gene_type:complete